MQNTLLFDTESNWSSHNWDLIDYVKVKNKEKFNPIITVCSSCKNPTLNPSSDHYIQEQGMILCEVCYLDYSLMNNN